MIKTLKIVGIFFLVLSPFSIVLGIHVLFINLVCGLLLLGMSEVLFSVRNVESMVLTSTLNAEYIIRLIEQSKRYVFVSDDLEIYNLDSEIFPLIILENEEYIPVTPLTNYVEPSQDEYIFKFPNNNEHRLKVYNTYQHKVDLFEVDNKLLVKASALGLSLEIEGDRVKVRIVVNN
jgi:hypothetical protein